MIIEITHHLSDAEVIFNLVVLGFCGTALIGAFILLIALAVSELRKSHEWMRERRK